MAHCGFEGTAVTDTFAHPIRALRVAFVGPDTENLKVPDPPIRYLDDHRESKQLPVKRAG